LWKALAKETWYFEGALSSLPPCTMHFTLKKPDIPGLGGNFRQRTLFCRALFAEETWYFEGPHSLLL